MAEMVPRVRNSPGTGAAVGLCPHYVTSINVPCAKLVADMDVDGYVSRQYTAPLALLRRDVAA